MGDNVVLKFQYLGVDVDVIVEDIDKVNMIDLVMEYWDKIEKMKTTCPWFPSFKYVHKMKHIELKDDKDLMDMFKNLEGSKEVYIWVGETDVPTRLVKDVMCLRSKRTNEKLQQFFFLFLKTLNHQSHAMNNLFLHNLEFLGRN